MICILMKYHGHTLQSAVDYVGDLCAQTIDAFSANKTQLPSWGPEIDDMVARYVQGLQDWIVGSVHLTSILYYAFDNINRSLHWSFQTHRYFGSEGMEVKRHRVVQLLPLETEELPRSLLTKTSEVSCTPKFSFGEQGALILDFPVHSPVVPSFSALRIYLYSSAFITMTVFILSIIFDLHAYFNGDIFVKI